MARSPSGKPDPSRKNGHAGPEITALLRRSAAGDKPAEDELIGLIYGQLRRMARNELRRGSGGPATQATGLVHELYLRLLRENPRAWPDRRYFFGAFARALHDHRIDEIRRRSARGKHVSLPSNLLIDGSAQLDQDIVALKEHLEKLEQIRPRAAVVFRAHFFVGLTIPEISQALELGHATVERDLLFARTWLHVRMRPSGSVPNGSSPNSSGKDSG